jgi:uncharacterized protein YecT (DUF1311 family)
MRLKPVIPLLVAALPPLLAPRSARAQQNCDEAQTTRDVTNCAIKASEAADKRLDRLVAEISQKFGRSYGSRLRGVQRLWARYRDAHCELDGESVRGGTVYPSYVALCYMDLTNERIKVLRDTLCPVVDECPAWLREEPAQRKGTGDD